MKIQQEFSNIKMKTKIRTTGSGLLTTIPKTVVQLLDLKEEDIIEWEINPSDNSINITLIKKE